MVDSDSTPGRWILTGSQNLALLESVSQSLAGRTGVLHLLPLTYDEVQRFDIFPQELEETIVAGAYPRVFDRHIAPAEWFASYVATYIERDVRTVSKVTDLLVFQRFLELCAGRTGQLFNASSLAADCGISQPTAKAWLGVLETSFLTLRLPPYLANLRKRLVKMPKLYFYDTGLVCWLLGIRSAEQLRNHPLRGAIFETWVVSEIVKHRTNKGLRGGMFFYRDKNGFEVDLVVEAGDRLLAVEAKSGRTVSPDMAKNASSFGETLDDGRTTRAYVVYAGEEAYESKGASFLPWKKVAEQPWQ
jgi:predicted AAA+ superfamily ATPase